MSTLAEYIAEIYDLDADEVQGHIDGFEKPKPKKTTKKAKTATTKTKGTTKTSVSDPPKKKATKTKVVDPPKKKVVKAKETVKRTCDRTVKGKEGPYRCGKNAKEENEVDGKWFCGTEASGHYKSALNEVEKTKAKSKPTTKKSTAKVATKKESSVVKKFAKQDKLNLQQIKKGSGIWTDPKSRICFHKDASCDAYGVLDEDNKTVLPLTKEAKEFLEAHGMEISEDAVKPSVKTKKTKTTPTKVKKAPAKVKKAPVKIEVEEEEVIDLEDDEIDEEEEEEVIDLEEDEVEEEADVGEEVDLEDDEIIEGDDEIVEEVEDEVDEEDEVEDEEDDGDEVDIEDEDVDIEEEDEGEAIDDEDDIDEDEDDEGDE